MLYWLFLSSAAAGGAILVCQFVLTLVGFGSFDSDHDASGDFDAEHSAIEDLDSDLSGGADGDGFHDAHHDGNWLFAMLSFRTLTAAAAFFGLGGLGASSLHYSPLTQVAIAALFGFAALAGVYHLLKSMLKLNTDNTVKITRAIGKNGTVYISIPADSAGLGKVQLTLQSRLMEYPAVTKWANSLKSGEAITVVGVVNNSTLEVAPLVASK